MGVPEEWPIPVDVILRFAVHLKDTGLSVRTIRGRLAALAFYSRAGGFIDHTSDFRVRRVLEGWAREAPPLPDSRLPVSDVVLQRMLPTLSAICTTPFETVLFQTAFTVAFFAATRISELLPKSKSDKSQRAIQVDDVTIGEEGMSVRFRCSKTDQLRRGQAIFLNRAPLGQICPVGSLERYLRVRPPVAGSLFVHASGVPLTQFQFLAVFKKAVMKVGLSPDHFSTHSFRIGAATAAATYGLPSAIVRKVGRWRSRVCNTYIRRQASDKLAGYLRGSPADTTTD